MEHYVRRRPEMTHVKSRCHRCRGTGRSPCEICRGSGQVMTGRDFYGRSRHDTCGACFGTKTNRCPVCHGEGFS